MALKGNVNEMRGLEIEESTRGRLAVPSCHSMLQDPETDAEHAETLTTKRFIYDDSDSV